MEVDGCGGASSARGVSAGVLGNPISCTFDISWLHFVLIHSKALQAILAHNPQNSSAVIS
jgi:hypothetical protein